ncbi:hypothetical protein CVIRNUC_005013 [Coccomyxa viridis]|uniref:Copper transport protein n=1 Tax=Coccomyxa viridis TaxID=1274662 RepID=A0AAV1I715_9CHLO|nr:hypothetical protein CVIRNUC_005013 [Coccomyxa viridis]
MAPQAPHTTTHGQSSSEAHHGGMGMMMMMQMYFTNSSKVTLWLQQWHTSNSGWYAMSVIGLFILAVLQEFMISYRATLGMKAAKATEGSSSDINVNLTGNRTIALPESRVRLALTALYAVNVAISYLLMLAIMTYNVGYFIAIVLGLAVGYFIFFNSSSATASTDVCCAQQHA